MDMDVRNVVRVFVGEAYADRQAYPRRNLSSSSDDYLQA